MKKVILLAVASVFAFSFAVSANGGSPPVEPSDVFCGAYQSQNFSVISHQGSWWGENFAFQDSFGNQEVSSVGVVFDGDCSTTTSQTTGGFVAYNTPNGFLLNQTVATQITAIEVNGGGVALSEGENFFGAGSHTTNSNNGVGSMDSAMIEMSGEVIAFGNNSASYFSEVNQTTGSAQAVSVPGGQIFSYSDVSQTGSINITTGE